MHAARTDISALRRARAARVAGFYAVTPDVADTAVLVYRVTAALDGGAAVVQYRNKAADDALRLRQAEALAPLCAARGTLFIVNDDASIAAAVDADGVHLGKDDADVAAARACVGPERLIGVSCYADLARAHAAIRAGADYVAFGSFFASTTKPGACRAERALLVHGRALGVPVVAIGGITSANAPALIDAGATAVAVISDLFARDSPQAIAGAACAIAALFAPASRRRES